MTKLQNQSNRANLVLFVILAVIIPQLMADLNATSISQAKLQTNTTTVIPDHKESINFDQAKINTEQNIATIEISKSENVTQPNPSIQQSQDIQVSSIKNDSFEIKVNSQMARETERQAQLEEEKHQQQIRIEEASLRPWISEQIKLFETHVEAIVSQSFEFILDPEAEFVFRWNPPKNKQLRLSIMVYRVLEGGNIELMKDIEENQFIDIQYRDQGKTYFKSISSVYVNKIININFDTDYKYFRFVSRIGRSVFVMVDLERQQQIAPVQGIAKDDHLYLATQKLAAIEQEVISGQKLREHTYKYEWGFLQNQYSHQSHLLGYTGVQLVIIMAAAITQIYLIKNLLDNRAVV